MKIKLIKIFVLMLTIILLLGASQVLAIDPNYYKPDITNQDNEAFVEKTGKMLGIISSVGSVCSVVIIAAIGIKYMLGSVEEKAEYKKTMTTYMIGAILLFSSTTIPNTIYKFADGSNKIFRSYRIENTNGYWCYGCDEYRETLSEEELRERECADCGSRDLYEVRSRYWCNICNNEVSEREKRQNECNYCSAGSSNNGDDDTPDLGPGNNMVDFN